MRESIIRNVMNVWVSARILTQARKMGDSPEIEKKWQNPSNYEVFGDFRGFRPPLGSPRPP